MKQLKKKEIELELALKEKILTYALDLIRELTEENERLGVENKALRDELTKLEETE